MKLNVLAFAAAVLASGSACAAGSACTSSFALGSMGPPATKSFGNSFSTSTTFTDCYDFSINAPASATGTTTELDAAWNFLWWTITLTDVEVAAVSLFNTATGAQVGRTDMTPNRFAFNNLAAGAYELVVNGYSNASAISAWAPASYTGTLATTRVAAPVPEPELYAMLALGLASAGFVARRRQTNR